MIGWYRRWRGRLRVYDWDGRRWARVRRPPDNDVDQMPPDRADVLQRHAR